MTESPATERRVLQVTSSGVLALLMVALVLFATGPKATISERENRPLATRPTLTLATVMDGRFARETESYVADHVPFRSGWLQLSDWLTEYRGLGTPEIQFFADRIDPEKRSEPADEEASSEVSDAPPTRVASNVTLPEGMPDGTPDASPATDSTAGVDTASRDASADVSREAAAVSADAAAAGAPGASGAASGDNEAYQRANSLILYRKRAIQAFRVAPDVVTKYVRVLERWAAEVGPSVRLYMMPIPIGSDFYLPPAVKGAPDHERLSIDRLFATMPTRVTPVRVYEELAPRRGEPIYFRTDHHWTGRGAYYGYQAFAKAARLQPLPMSALTVRTCSRFLGSLYSQTRSPVLRANPDTVEVPMIRNTVQVRQLLHDQRTWQRGALYHGCRGYQSFLGLDYPLMTFESDVANGRRILVIKDSYGNAFVPFLAAHYEKVWVVDYRYYAGSVLRLIADNAIDEVVFVHNIQVLNSPFIRTREVALMRGGTPLSIAPKKAPSDSTARRDSASRPVPP